MRNSERGMSVWPFVITLLLLLLFVFLWFSEKGNREQLTADKLKVEAQKEEAGAIAAAYKTLLDRTGQVVGFWSKPPVVKVMKPDGTEETLKSEGWVNPDLVAEQNNPDTPGGLVSQVRKAATVTMRQDLWRPKPGQPAATAVDFGKLPQGFKDKVKAAFDAFPGPAPMPPADPDDAGAQADYGSQKAEYEQKLANYRKMMDDLAKAPEWPQFQSAIGASSPYELEKTGAQAWPFWYPASQAPTTLEEATKQPAVIIAEIVKGWTEMANAQLATIESLTKDKAALEKVIDNADEAAPGLKQQLEKEQAAHTADNERLSKEASSAKADAEIVRVKATTAENALAKLEQDTKLERARGEQERSALENRIRTDKEMREIEIQRNDPDGIVLDANSVLGVGYVNLGSADKVYPGLKFQVSAVGRGGLRDPKGEVMITRVIDPHYSQVRIVASLSADRPIGKGDLIANPLFSKSRPMRVYLAGELRKYPKAIAVERLSRMGVVVQDKITIDTDYVVVPDTVAVGAPAPAEGAEGEAAAAPAAQTEYDRLQTLARNFGATLMTERMLEALLDY
jgi:hypothetical protein